MRRTALAALATLAVGGVERGATAPAAPACTAPEFRQLDFWLGDWDVYDLGAAQPAARAHITRLLDGCVVHELYEQADGMRGESFSIFDRSRGVWHQTWVTNRGRLLQIDGSLQQGHVVLSGSYRDDAGRSLMIRGSWWPSADGVREFAETSADAGHSWQSAFDLIFRPHHD